MRWRQASQHRGEDFGNSGESSNLEMQIWFRVVPMTWIEVVVIPILFGTFLAIRQTRQIMNLRGGEIMFYCSGAKRGWKSILWEDTRGTFNWLTVLSWVGSGGGS